MATDVQREAGLVEVGGGEDVVEVVRLGLVVLEKQGWVWFGSVGAVAAQVVEAGEAELIQALDHLGEGFSGGLLVEDDVGVEIAGDYDAAALEERAVGVAHLE